MIYMEYNAQNMHADLKEAGRNNFSITALEAYVSYIDDLGSDESFDPVGFDCEYIEYDLTDDKDLQTVLQDYAHMLQEVESDDLDAIKEAFNNETTVICNESTNFMFSYNF